MNAADLIAASKTSPPKPVIEGLLNEGETVGLHRPPEVFKTILSLQMADSMATGRPFLSVWPVPRPLEVFFLETEMSVAALGNRLSRIYPEPSSSPTGIRFATETQLKQFRKAHDLQAKFGLLRGWVSEARTDVVMLDTANAFFRGKQSPNDETYVGGFFDLLDSLPAPVKMFVRHNHKRRLEDDDSDAAAKIRGSGQWADVPDFAAGTDPSRQTNESSCFERHQVPPTVPDLTI